jgi:hypothetical protein
MIEARVFYVQGAALTIAQVEPHVGRVGIRLTSSSRLPSATLTGHLCCRIAAAPSYVVDLSVEFESVRSTRP